MRLFKIHTDKFGNSVDTEEVDPNQELQKVYNPDWGKDTWFWFFPKDKDYYIHIDANYAGTVNRLCVELDDGRFDYQSQGKKTGITASKLRKLTKKKLDQVSYEFRDWDGNLIPSPLGNGFGRMVAADDGNKYSFV